MSIELEAFSEVSAEESNAQYRALSGSAVVALILGLISVATQFAAENSLESTFFMSILPIIGIVVGAIAIVTIRRRRDEYTGLSLAVAGLGLSLLFLVGGLTRASYVYAHEVPEGYHRLGFLDFRPSDEERADRVLIPNDISKLTGQKVFLKGFMRPGAQRMQLEEFLLVRDNNECCFGTNMPMYFDQIQVQLSPELRANYGTRMFRVGGTLYINNRNVSPDARQAVFTLVADYLK